MFRANSPINETTQTATQANLLSGEWKYLPGSRMAADGLHIEPRGFAIVAQKGPGSQPNPPLNLFGTHLKNVSDATITATVLPAGGTASLRLYGEVPIIADEFRVERKSLGLSITNSTLTVTIFGGAPTVYPFASTDKVNLAITKQAGKLAFTVNGAQLGAVDEAGVFASGTIWFGADAPGAAWTLAAFDAHSLTNTPLTIADSSTFDVPAKPADSLQALASKKRPGFTIGAAMAAGPMASDPEYRATALNQFGAMTTENDLKWQFIHPQPGQYDFAQADGLLHLALQQGLKIQAHTLVFGEANPAWVQNLPVTTAADKQHVEAVMLDHIATVAGHYKGNVFSWDVVNEPLADYPEFENGQLMRNHIWYQAMGKAYIAKAFYAARQADPSALLFMNEFGLEDDGERWDTFLALVTDLKQQGVPIDGVGFQAHVYESGDKIHTGILASHMQKLAALGLKSRISEMDVYSEDGTQVQTQQYADVLNTCLNQPSCISFTTWGITDRYDYFKDDDGSTQTGDDFLYDARMQPKAIIPRLRQILGV